MTWIILLLCIFILLTDNKKVIPVFLISSMWINFDIRCGSISLISALSIFIIILGFFTRKRNLVFKTNIDTDVSNFCYYLVLINIPFMLFSTDLSFVTQLNLIKSQIVYILLIMVMWKWRPCSKNILDKQILSLNISTIIVCLYGLYTYITMTNPYMDFMSQYSTKDNLSDLLAFSLEDARGILHGRITGTSLYTIQYGIMLVSFFFILSAFYFIRKKNIFEYSVYLLIVINIYLTGSRGPLGALMVGCLFFILRKLNWTKRITYVSIFSILTLIIWPYIEPYLLLFTDKNAGGSSFEMRKEQFGGALSMVAGDMQSLLFGRGLGYTSYYLANFGRHPIALNFESTHVSGIVNYGALGLVFIFLGKIIFLLYIAIKAYRKKLVDNKTFNLLLAFILTYFIYNMLVGNVYEGLFLVCYFLSLKIGIVNSAKLEIYKMR